MGGARLVPSSLPLFSGGYLRVLCAHCTVMTVAHPHRLDLSLSTLLSQLTQGPTGIATMFALGCASSGSCLPSALTPFDLNARLGTARHLDKVTLPTAMHNVDDGLKSIELVLSVINC